MTIKQEFFDSRRWLLIEDIAIPLDQIKLFEANHYTGSFGPCCRIMLISSDAQREGASLVFNGEKAKAVVQLLSEVFEHDFERE
jgi:hypothetical protein